MIKYCIPFLLILTVSACGFDNGRIAGHYYGKEKLFLHGNIKLHSYLGDNSHSPLFTDAGFMDFYKNGDYVMNIHTFEYGDYYLEEDTIHLTSSTGKEWKLGFATDPERDVWMFFFGDKRERIELARTDNDDWFDYPFDRNSNKWRLKEEKDLTTNEIIDKLQNHLHFVEEYMNWGNEHKTRAKFYNLPSPINVSAYGFQVKKKTDMQPWCALFANAEDCEESQNILHRYFRSGRFEWLKSDNPLLRLTDATAQIREGLEEYRE